MNPYEEEDMNTPNETRGRRRGHHHPHRGGPRMGEGMPMHRGRGGRGPGRGPGRGRAPRGDVRTAVLMLLSEEPMHGYQLMQAIADRSGGRWTPSPGAIYPTINQLEDEGLVSVTAEAGRKLVTLTDAGRAYETSVDPFAAFEQTEPATDLRGLLEELHIAARQVGRSGSEEQRAAAAKILAEARRSLYLLLADGPQTPEV
ncbi:PadR family transcriptional regulator [Kribbella antibiotica]|uniref:PadR family transcriptional regulator n=1 Tax=Kribbella antibiotica TaxID=190195 RepID=A0A4V2YMJ6_9ACTN|nr:PadR family transcriptional regulator [Kribbella antibiotica]TDD50197.1 PadR family transcriptional regulator [Kribbella antibiotica]